MEKKFVKRKLKNAVIFLKSIFALKWQLLAARNACNEFRKVEFAYKSCHFPEQT